MTRKIFTGKTQRGNEILTPLQRLKIHELYRVHLIEPDLIAERYDTDEAAIITILKSPPPKHTPTWQVRWDDSSGDRHTKSFKTFQAAQCFSATLKDVEWKRIERV